MRYVIGSIFFLILGIPISASGPIHPDGTQVQCDLPVELRMFNVGGSDGAGLCVYSSVTMAANFQGESRLYGFRKWAEHRPGGSWPEKLEKDRSIYAPDVPMLQVTGADLSFIRLCLENGYVVSTTWGMSHMVNIVHLDDKHAVILDNNSAYEKGPNGERKDTRLFWTTPQDYMNRNGGGPWIVVLLDKGPPAPIPVNDTGDPGLNWHPDIYTWWHNSAHAGDLYLHRNGHLIGGWTKRYTSEGAYYPREGPGKWLPATEPPVGIPSLPSIVPAGETVVCKYVDNGCYYRRSGRESTFTINGKTVDRATAERLITRFSQSRSVVVVGDPALQKQVETDWNTNPLFAPYRGQIPLQLYDINNPMATNVGLALGVSIQGPRDFKTGKAKVLYRLRSYSPELLIAALRGKDPTYNPELDPDPAKPVPSMEMSSADWTAYLPIGVLSLLLCAVAAAPSRKPTLPVQEVELGDTWPWN